MTGLLSSMMSPLCLPVQGSEQSRPPPPHIGGYLPWDPVPVRTGSSAVDTPLGYFLLLLLGLVEPGATELAFGRLLSFLTSPGAN